jgi:hypothetical protein
MEISLNITGYKDHLKRISIILGNEIKDNFKKIDFIEEHHPDLARGQFNIEHLQDEFNSLQTINPTETSIRNAENKVKTLKVLLNETRSLINRFEENEGILYEFELAKILSKKANEFPEQINPSDLSSLPYFGNVGGKKRKKTKKTSKKQKGGSKTKKIYKESYPPGIDPYILDAIYESRFSKDPSTSSDKKFKYLLEFSEGVKKDESLELRFEEDYENNKESYQNDPLYQKMLTHNPNPDERIHDIRQAKRIIFAEREGKIPLGLPPDERKKQALAIYDKEFMNAIYRTLKVGYQNFVLVVDTLLPFKGKKLNQLSQEKQTYLSKFRGIGQQLDSAVMAYNQIINSKEDSESNENLKKYITPEQYALVKLSNKALSPEEYGFLKDIGKVSDDEITGGVGILIRKKNKSKKKKRKNTKRKKTKKHK